MKETMTDARPTSPLLLAAAWLMVSVPLAWGVYNTALAAARLFTSPGAPVGH
jgi:hypothetical protein